MNRRRFWFSLLLPGVLAVAAPASVHAQRQKTIDAILKAWQERQERFRTVQASFEGEYVTTKGAFSRTPSPKVPYDGTAGPLPPEDHKAGDSESLVIGAGKYRHEVKGQHTWSEQERTFRSVDSTVTFDGKIRKSKRETAGRDPRQGSIQIQTRPGEVGDTALYPLMMSFRPVDLVFRSFDINEFSPTGAVPAVGANTCIELTKRKVSDQYVLSVCLDPARDYVMTRMRTHLKNVLMTHVEITYKRDPEYGWVPDSWHIDSYEGTGRLFGSRNERVTGYVFNASVDEKTFDLDFEPLTLVRDNPRNEFFIVREDGSRRRVGMDELTKPFQVQELLATEPKVVDRPVVRKSVIVVLAAVVLALTTALLAHRWRRRTRAASG
jgi:hypothetical protein